MTRELSSKDYSPGIRWDRRCLRLLDQRYLPRELKYVECSTAVQVASAIRDMVIRGAPAIGIAAAYAVALGVRQHAELPTELRLRALARDLDTLRKARPTAVNLAWALDRLQPLAESGKPFPELAAAAERIHYMDVVANQQMAQLGSELIGAESRLLTHCNTGPLATGGIGTAFGVVTAAWRQKKVAEVRFTETRPWAQGARLTAWEFSREDVPAILMTDLAAAGLTLSGGVDWLIVGADRIAANGDVINKIGTAPLAALTAQSGGRVMVVAPWSTVDLSLATGEEVAIEVRDGEELWRPLGIDVAPDGIKVSNPVFDVTPAKFVDVIVTQRGINYPSRGERLTALDDSGE